MAEQNQEPKGEFRHLVRIANTDLNGNKQIVMALTKIKGIGIMMANALCRLANIDKRQKAGYLPQEKVDRLDELVKNPGAFGCPNWLFNRRKDYETGEDMHLITGELDFSKSNDIKMMQMIKCYKGVRHIHKLPVRGQKTRSNFRKNKGKVLGVQRKKAAAAAASSEKEKGGGKEKKK